MDSMRLGNVRLLNVRQASQLSLQSPRVAVNRLHDLAFGTAQNKFPRNIYLHLANRCNFACPMCSIGQARADRQDEFLGDMPFPIVEKAVMEGSRHGAYIDLFGGEPTLYPHLGQALNLIKGRSLSFITTNGLLVKKLAKELVENGLNVLLVSLDGWDEESQAKRGEVPGSFDTILEGLAEVMRLRGRRAFPIVRLSTVVTKVNYHSIDKIAKVVYDAGVRDWTIANYFFITDEAMRQHREFKAKTGIGNKVMQHHISDSDSYFTGEQVASLKTSMARVKGLLETSLRDMRVNYDWEMDLDKYYSPAPPSHESSCALPYTRVDVFPDGRIALCGDGHTIGNILEGSIAEAWNGERMKEFRRAYESARIMPMCFRCCGITNDLKIGNIAPAAGRQDRLPVLQ
jgi:MoaA/NifB/PqqE/SkfB family radical SAM enzyme